jgi:hypothetical protein
MFGLDQTLVAIIVMAAAVVFGAILGALGGVVGFMVRAHHDERETRPH